jgi:glycosyltransferase involved in cell wall biosynthesis
VLAISEHTKSDVCEYLGIHPERVFVTPLAADRRVFYPCSDPERLEVIRTKYGIPPGPYLLSLNTLEPRKNLDHAIRAFSRVVHEERVRDLRFVLVGATGWRYETIFSSLAEAGLARAQIVFPGYVADEDLATLYSGALGFIYPSLYEGFGLPPLEAMQCGVPVVTSNTSSLPEVVGDAGIMLNPQDVSGLAQSMLDLYRDASLRERMRAKSIAQAQRFDWNRSVDATLAAYRTALTGSTGRT